MSTLHRSLALGLTCAVLAAPAAAARPQDLRSPDARDAATRTIVQDLRSPDARDAAASPRPSAVPVSASAPARPESTSDWTPIVLPAAAFLFTIVLAAATVAMRGRRRAMTATRR